MSYFSFNFKTLLLALPLLGALASCKKEVDTFYQPVSDPGFAGLGLPRTPLAPRYAPGETVPLFVTFNETEALRDITVFQVVNRADSVVTGTYPAAGTINASGGLLAQAVPYVVPATAVNGVSVRVDVTLTFQNGAQRQRRFTYVVAQPITVELATTPVVPLYRNALAANAQSEGDVIGYPLVLNRTGIGIAPTPPALPTAAAPLFKAIDSLTTFYTIGSQPRVRVGLTRNPSNGAANARTVDVTIPRGALGQSLTYTFVAYGAVQTVSVTTPPITAVAPTPLATLRTGRVSGGPAVTSDSLAFNLRTGQIEPAANPPAAKDLFVSTTTSPVTLSAANNTTYTRITPLQIDRGFYTAATANAVGTALYVNATVGPNLGPVAAGDVFAARVRGAELVLLRILSVRPGATGASARVRFEYKSL